MNSLSVALVLLAAAARGRHAPEMAGIRPAWLTGLPMPGIYLGSRTRGNGPSGVRAFRLMRRAGVGVLTAVVGVILLCAGVVWSGRITSQVVVR